MSMHEAFCDHCGQKHTFRTMSEGTIRKCARCGEKFELHLPASVAYPERSSGSVLPRMAVGCVLTALFGMCIIGAGVNHLSRGPNSPITSGLKLVRATTTTAARVTRPTRAEEPKLDKEAEAKAAEKALQEKSEREKAQREADEKALEEKRKKDEATASAKLKIAKQLSPDAMIRKLREIVRMYPETNAAKEAKELLARLK